MQALEMGLAVLLLLVILVGVLYSVRYICQYEVGDKAIRIKLLGAITIRRIPLNEIAEVKIVQGWGGSRSYQYLFAERWPSNVFTTKWVFIRRNTGISRFFALSPLDPENFVAEVLRHKRGNG
jgi:hypothetical protein